MMDRAGMGCEHAGAAVPEPEFEGVRDGRERDFVPRYFGFIEQVRLQTFRARRECAVGEAGAEHDVDLIDPRDVEAGEQAVEFHPGVRFLAGFPHRRFPGCLAVLHESGRERPPPPPWLDRTTAEQDLAFPLRNGPRHDLRILIVDGCAGIADVARAVVAGGGAQHHWRRTPGAEIHEGFSLSSVRRIADAAHLAHPVELAPELGERAL